MRCVSVVSRETVIELVLFFSSDVSGVLIQHVVFVNLSKDGVVVGFYGISGFPP